MCVERVGGAVRVGASRLNWLHSSEGFSCRPRVVLSLIPRTHTPRGARAHRAKMDCLVIRYRMRGPVRSAGLCLIAG